LGVVHSSPRLGGLLDLPHGLCNALLVGAASDYNFVAAPQRYADIVDALSEGFGGRGKRIPLRGDAASARGILSDLILSLRAEVGLSGGLGTRGLSPSFIPALARSAFLDACLATNPRKPSVADLEALYAAAL
jgi:alcohol dehydrogenase class IV